MRKKTAFAFYLAAAATALIVVGCTAHTQDPAFEKAQQLPSYTQQSFEQYLQETKQWLNDNRLFISDDKES
jgi:outer membrane biogenesis lipoprotein LolB